MLDTKVVIALGPTVYDNAIKRKKLSIEKLYKKLSEPKIRNKKDGPYFVFASFSKDIRNASNIKYYYGATLDIDYDNLSPSDIRSVLRPLQCNYCIYTTHSHIEKGNRYRVVIPYTSPVKKDKHIDTVIYLNMLFGVSGPDTSSKALSRPMYFPSCPSKYKKHFYYFQSKSSALFDPDQQVKIPDHIRWEMQELNAEETEKIDITSDIIEGGRNEHIARTTGTLIQQGKTLQEIIDFCDEINQLKFTPPLKSSEVARTVKSIWKSHQRNSNDKDWSYKQLNERIKKIDNIEPELDHILEAIALSKKKEKTTSLEAEKLLMVLKKKDKTLTMPILRDTLKEKESFNRKQNKKEQLEIDQEIDGPLIDKIKKEFKDFYFVSSCNLIFNRKYGAYYKLEGFNNQYSSLKQDFDWSKLTPFKILDEIGAIDKVDVVKYHPGKPKLFKDYNGMWCCNSFRKSNVKPYKGSTRLLKRHFRYLFPNQYERNVILDFIAYNYQYPGKKIMWIPIIKGRKGIGKSIIANHILAPMFGYNNIRQLNNSKIFLKEYNAWQTDAQIVIIHELFASNRFDVKQQITEDIKSCITDKFLNIRRMYQDLVQQENITNMAAFTNHDESVYVTPDERRFCMIRCEVEPRSSLYYRRLVDFLEENPEAVAYFFKNRKIKTIDPHVLPMTDYTRQVMTASRNWAETIIVDELSDGDSVFNNYKAMTWNSICHIVMQKVFSEGKSASKYADIYNGTSSVGRVLRQSIIEENFKAWVSVTGSNRIRINGKLETIWITPFGNKHKFKDYSAKIIKKEVEKCAKLTNSDFSEFTENK